MPASLTEPFANAIHSVERAVRQGDEVLVIGAGPIGLFAARAASSQAPRARSSPTGCEARLALARSQGAEPLAAEGAAARSRRPRGGGRGRRHRRRGVPRDVGAGAARRSAGRPRGGDRPRRRRGPVSYHGIVTKGLTVVGSYACVESDFDRALALLAAGEVDVDGWIT